MNNPIFSTIKNIFFDQNLTLNDRINKRAKISYGTLFVTDSNFPMYLWRWDCSDENYIFRTMRLFFTDENNDLFVSHVIVNKRTGLRYTIDTELVKRNILES